MSASSDLTRGEIAYDGYHATDETYTPFNELPEDEQWRWAQAACNACDAWTKPSSLSATHWRTSTRAAHAHLRNGHNQSHYQRLIDAARIPITGVQARSLGYYWVLFEAGSPLPDGSTPRVWTIGELVSLKDPITLYVIGWDAPVGEPIEWGPRIEVPIGYVTGQL